MRWLGPLLILLVSGTSFVSAAPKPSPSPTPAPTPPKPAVAIALQRSAIRENDELQARVLISNEWDKPLLNVLLRVNAPSFLTWNDTSCNDWKNAGYKAKTQDVATIGTIGPNDFREVTICFKSGSDILVGEFNVSFTGEYSWPTLNGTGRAFVTTDKVLKSNLLGSDTVAGVPIALAAFIVPGLFFWLMISWLRVPWNLGPGLGDKLVYSVIVSLILLWLISLWNPASGPAVSLPKLIQFALGGAVAGAVVSGLDHLGRYIVRIRRENRDRIRKAGEVKLGEDAIVLLRKLLTLRSGCRQPKAVLRTPDTEYHGSLVAKTEETVALVGWFRIDKSKIVGTNRQEVINALQAAKGPLDLFNLAMAHKLEIEPRNGTIEIKASGEEEGDVRITLPADKTNVEQLCNTGGDEPLILE